MAYPGMTLMTRMGRDTAMSQRRVGGWGEEQEGPGAEAAAEEDWTGC